MLKSLSCKPGSYVEIIPIGLLCTLQYNSNGILQKIILGFDPINHTDKEVFSPELTIQLKSKNKIPQRILFTQGTTWVKGVFYNKKNFKGEGILPECIYADAFTEFQKDPSEFYFYACDLHNDSFNFAGGALISTRLKSFGFDVVPGYQVFDALPVLPVEQIMWDRKSPFKFPYISGIMVYDTCSRSRYISADLSQKVISTLTEHQDENGFLWCTAKFLDSSIEIPFSDVVSYDITEKCTIILDSNKVLASRKPATIFNTKVSRNKNCPVCGRKMIVPHSGNSHCSDEHCPSRIYSNVVHFLNTLGFSPISFQDFSTHVKSKEITCILDVLNLDAYKNQTVETTLSNLLFAIVPFEICRGVDFFQKFTNYLGSVEALDFYIDNPDLILSDLNLNKMYSKKFVEWIKDPVNVVHLKAVLNMKDQIKIVSVKKKFEGAPIFRGKNICLTGKFQHGTIEDVISIIQSYSGKASTSFDNTVSCVVIGHYEGEDTDLTNLAMSYNVPIYSEDDFFKAYEIDLDIRKQRDVLSSYLE